jgi:aspartyl-tRNA(Asn)/glutamyl-tRNA(Gln) amidotransferase subunit A
MELTSLNIAQAHSGLKKKEFSSLELTKAFLSKIKKEDKKISSYITISDKLALAQAQEADRIISKGRDFSSLTGVPMAVKDIILVEGIKNTCASKILKNYLAPYDAFCIKKLKKLGAVILGKTNLDEFAMGSSTENSAFFSTKNPRDLKKVPGGSSGGSAAAVAADLACYSLGSDTGGSIRQPASFCGVVGLKPTYGAVSRYGLVAFASSLDQIGPITKTAEDAQIVFEAIKGKDSKDSTSVELRSRNQEVRIKSLRIGIPKEYFVSGMDPEVEKIIKQSISQAEKQGARLVEISLPHTKHALAAYYIIMPSEASANLARYDGIKYGLSKSSSKDLLEVYLESKGQGFGDEVKRRIMLGTYALSAGYYDAYYLKAQKVRTLIKQDFENAFKKVDAIFTPTSPFPAFELGEKIADPLSMYLSDIFTVSVNLVGLPAVSVPVGFTKNRLPVGLQIIGKGFEENRILEIAKIYE